VETASLHSFWLSFVCLLAASVLLVRQMLMRKSSGNVVTQIITICAWLTLTMSIGFNSVVHGRTPFTGGNTLVLIAWLLILVYFGIEYLLRFKRYGAILIPVAAVLLFIAQVANSAGSKSIAPGGAIDPQIAANIITFHVLLIMIANALLLIAMVAAVLYLYRDRSLRKHNTLVLSKRLPSLANLERLSSNLITVALPLYFAAQILGITRAIATDVVAWYFDPRIMLSGVILIIFIVYSLLYYRQRTSGITTAWIAVIGGFFVIALMIIARTLPVGFHIFGVV
jgi:HemX protein